jgi:hypothetical protein
LGVWQSALNAAACLERGGLSREPPESDYRRIKLSKFALKLGDFPGQFFALSFGGS